MTVLVKPLLLISFIVALAVPQVSHAQSRAELAAQNAALAERVERLEQRMLTGDPAAERLMARVDTLETTMRALKGEVERLTYEHDLAKTEVDALEGDIRILQELSARVRIHLDEADIAAAQAALASQPRVDDTYVGGPPTISQIPGAPTARTENFSLPSETPAAPAVDTNLLAEVGKRKLEEADYTGAEADLSAYLDANPSAPDAADVNFWLGEARYILGQFNGAADAYVTSLRLNPRGDKAPDAHIRLGSVLGDLGQTNEACGVFSSFTTQFPSASVTDVERARREAERTGCP